MSVFVYGGYSPSLTEQTVRTVTPPEQNRARHLTTYTYCMHRLTDSFPHIPGAEKERTRTFAENMTGF